MASFTFYTAENAPEGSKPLLEESLKDFGMVPNLHSVLAVSPEALEAYKMLHTIFQKTSFNADELTVVWQSINVEHGCQYCVPGHTAISNMMNVDTAISDALRNETPLPDDKLEALRTFTLAVVRERGVVSDAALQAFFDAGYTQQNVMEILVGLAQKVMSNYTNHMANTPVDAPFEKFAWKKKVAVAAE